MKGRQPKRTSVSSVQSNKSTKSTKSNSSSTNPNDTQRSNKRRKLSNNPPKSEEVLSSPNGKKGTSNYKVDLESDEIDAVKSSTKSIAIINDNSEKSTSDLFLSTWLQCGKLALDLNSNYEVAIRCFESSLKYSPTNIDAINCLVDSLVNKDHVLNTKDGVKHAIELIDASMNSYPETRTNLSLWAKLSEYYLLIDDFEKSHSVILTALEFTKSDPSLWLGLGKCLIKLNLLKDAIEALNNALYLLPSDLKDSNEINIARSVHLEMTTIGINDGDLENARNELSSALSLPPPSDIQTIALGTALTKHLVISFEKSDILINSLSICELAENALPNENSILLLHTYLLLLNDKPFFNPSKAKQLSHKVIQNEKDYATLPSLADFINSSAGDFLPWLFLAECYFHLKYYTVSFDCLEIATRKIFYVSSVDKFRDLAVGLFKKSKNEPLNVDIGNYLKFLDETPQVKETLDLMTITGMTSEERVEYFGKRDEFPDLAMKNNIKAGPKFGFLLDSTDGKKDTVLSNETAVLSKQPPGQHPMINSPHSELPQPQITHICSPATQQLFQQTPQPDFLHQPPQPMPLSLQTVQHSPAQPRFLVPSSIANSSYNPSVIGSPANSIIGPRQPLTPQVQFHNHPPHLQYGQVLAPLPAQIKMENEPNSQGAVISSTQFVHNQQRQVQKNAMTTPIQVPPMQIPMQIPMQVGNNGPVPVQFPVPMQSNNDNLVGFDQNMALIQQQQQQHLQQQEQMMHQQQMHQQQMHQHEQQQHLMQQQMQQQMEQQQEQQFQHQMHQQQEHQYQQQIHQQQMQQQQQQMQQHEQQMQMQFQQQQMHQPPPGQPIQPPFMIPRPPTMISGPPPPGVQFTGYYQ